MNPIELKTYMHNSFRSALARFMICSSNLNCRDSLSTRFGYPERINSKNGIAAITLSCDLMKSSLNDFGKLEVFGLIQ